MKIINADWPATNNITAFTTTRLGGMSQGCYASLNLGDHVQDDPKSVQQNREQLIKQMALPNKPAWLQQTHSTIAVNVDADFNYCKADASYTHHANHVCVVMTADCLPILLCNTQGTEVAAIHAGWKGLADGIIESTVNSLNSNPNDLLAWLGPAIGPTAFEVGNDVRDIYVQRDPKSAFCFKPIGHDKWLMNIYQLARQRLTNTNVKAIYGGNYCTYNDAEHFYSYRRDGITGRMASIIYFN